jgi:hypothetical protein
MMPEPELSNQITESSIPEPPFVLIYDLVGQFNEIFHDRARAVIRGKQLLITIGNRTMHIQLPMVVGAESTGSSD